MPRKRIVAIVAVLAIAGAATTFAVVQSNGADGGDTLVLSGNVEVTEARVSFRLAGPLVDRLVDEGDRIHIGDVLARIDAAVLEREVAIRQAEYATADAALAELRAGSRPEDIAAARAERDAAQARLDEVRAGARAEDIAQAVAALAVLQAQLDELHRGTREEVIAQVRATRDAAKAQLDEALAGARKEEIDAAQATVRRAEANAEQADRDFERAKELVSARTISTREAEVAATTAKLAHTQLEEAREQLALLLAGTRPERVAALRASLAHAQAVLDQAEYGPLKETIAAQQARVDQAAAALGLLRAGARAEVIAGAAATLASLEARLQRAINGPRVETIAQAEARTAQAREALELARTQLGFGTLVAPFDGVVLAKHAEPGEYLAPGSPVVTIADIENVFVRAYIRLVDLERVRLGQAVDVRTDSGGTLPGTIAYISDAAEFTPKTVSTKELRVSLVYRIRVRVVNSDGRLKAGIPVEVIVNTKEVGS